MLLFFPLKSLRHLGIYYQEIKAKEIQETKQGGMTK